MSQKDTAIHLVAGGVAGTAGAVVTCPLEVVKTRLQSSKGVGAPQSQPPSDSTPNTRKICSKIPKPQVCQRSSREEARNVLKCNINRSQSVGLYAYSPNQPYIKLLKM